jgi:Caspase domain
LNAFWSGRIGISCLEGELNVKCFTPGCFIRKSLIAALLCLVVSWAFAARQALVIGISSYSGDSLPEVRNDAEAIAGALSDLGFMVYGDKAQLNLSRKDMLGAVSGFLGLLKSGDTALFYYSGHGFETIDENYLVSADGQGGVWVETDIIDKIGSITGGPKIVILDTCRKLGLPELGLSRPGVLPLNSIVAYGSPPKRSIAYPSEYTKNLLVRLREPGLEIVDLMRATKESMVLASQSSGRAPQQPVEYGGLTEKFFFRPAAGITIRIGNADDDLKVVVNGEQQVSWRTNGAEPKRVTLNAGVNTLELRVHNWRTFTGGIEEFGGHKPEGWNYKVTFFDDAGNMLGSLDDGEGKPAKDGPRHGKEFLAASGTITVDAKSGGLVFKAAREKR